ncbi:MAG: hypothetical protein ACWA5U_10155 [bacterium]
MNAFYARLWHVLPRNMTTQLRSKARLFSTWSVLFIVLLSCNQTAIFASTEHTQDNFTLTISPHFSVKISPKMQQLDQRRTHYRSPNRYRSRYEIRLFNHQTNEQHSAFIRPIFGKITEVLLHDGIITVFMEGTSQQQHYIMLDHYQMVKRALPTMPSTHQDHIDVDSSISQNLPDEYEVNAHIPSVYLKHLPHLRKHADAAALLSTMQVTYNPQLFPKGLPHASGFTLLNAR